MSALDSIRSRTWDEWLLGAAVTKTVVDVSKSVGWRRPVRAGVTAVKGAGHFGRAAGYTMRDFIRGQSLGNKPFAFEPYVAPGAAVALYGATPLGMVLAAYQYPLVAGPQQQSAVTGQPSIGSAGHGLIYGGLNWDWLSW